MRLRIRGRSGGIRALIEAEAENESEVVVDESGDCEYEGIGHD